jgi:1-acyl-sn-glycerol-3-phosphate acyltransferase
MVTRAAEALRAGDTLVMFPEGTRTRPGEPLVFLRGAASVAVQAAAVLTPVYVTAVPTFLPKSQPWYRVPRVRPHLVLRVGDDIPLEDYRSLPAPKASRMLNVWLLAHYRAVLGQGAVYNEAAVSQGSRSQCADASPQDNEIEIGVAVNDQ